MSLWQRITDVFQVKRCLRAPLFAALALRVALMIAAFALAGTTVMTQGDTASYLNPGRTLILRGVFATGGLPEIDRTPGYPLFAEVIGMAWNNVLLAVAVQIVLSLISLLLVQRIASHIFSNRNAGSVAAWLNAIEPLSIVYSVRLMPETLFVLILLLVIERVQAFLQSGKLANLAAAGVLLAAATYVRPVSCYLVFPLAAVLAIVAPKQRGLRWKAPAVLLITVLPLLVAWQIRNRVETGYNGFSSIIEKNLYFFQSAEVSAELQHISLSEQQKQLGYPEDAYYFAVHPGQSTWSQSQRLSFMRRQAFKVLAAHPLLYLKTHFAGVAVVAFTPGVTELLQLLGAYPADGSMPHRIVNEGVATSVESVILSHPQVAITMAFLEVFLLFLYIASIRGCMSANRAHPAIPVLIGIAMYFLLISGGAQAVGRYRQPVMPELCILAAGALTLPRKRKLRSHDSPAVISHGLS